jgi:hypothetical protein
MGAQASKQPKESLTEYEKQIVLKLINAFKDQSQKRFNNYVILEDTTSMTPSEIGYFVDVIVPNDNSIDKLIDVIPIKQRALMGIFTNLIANNEKIKNEIAKLQPITTGGVKKKGAPLPSKPFKGATLPSEPSSWEKPRKCLGKA